VSGTRGAENGAAADATAPAVAGPIVEVLFAGATRVESLAVPWHSGLTVQAALQAAAALVATVPGFDACGLGVYGERVGPGDLLHPGDRLEILPPLPQDPKASRRQRVLDAKAQARADAERARAMARREA
jgi:putative ubiquitin-RnfH superfamily antitoxin RatB of RatAB toxin-antitoxin module